MLENESKRFGSKEVSSVSMIRDGKPTSFFIVGKNNSKHTPKQKIQKFLYDVRKKRIVKSLKVNPHSMEQVADYIVIEFAWTMRTDRPSNQNSCKGKAVS